MERLELDVLAPVAQQVHHHLEVRFICNISRHDVEIRPIKKDLAEQLQRLSFGDVVRGHDELRVGREELRATSARRPRRKIKWTYSVIVLV